MKTFFTDHLNGGSLFSHKKHRQIGLAVAVLCVLHLTIHNNRSVEPDFIVTFEPKKVREMQNVPVVEEQINFNEDTVDLIDPAFTFAELKKPHLANQQYFSESYSYKTPTKAELNKISRVYGVPDNVLYYQMMKESRGKVMDKHNAKGALGYFQFLDKTAKQMGLLTPEKDWRTNAYASADASARYLLWNIALLNGEGASLDDEDSLKFALAAYNAGHKRLMRNGQTRLPRFYETINYVNDIVSLSRDNAILIQPGDTLEKISARVGLSVEVLLESNHKVKRNQDLKAHEVFHLPDEDGYSRVVIKRGMSLFSIQNGTGISIDEIRKANELSGDVILVADVMKLPTSLSM